MKTYPATIADLSPFADMAAQIDHVRSLLPAECLAVRECAVLQARGHDAVTRLLGSDEHLVYAPDDGSSQTKEESR